MELNKAEYVMGLLTGALKAMDSEVHSCTYEKKPNGEEIVTVWSDCYGQPNAGIQVNVTCDSLAQLTMEVIKKAIM